MSSFWTRTFSVWGSGEERREEKTDRVCPRELVILDFFGALQNSAAHETGVLIFLVANITGWKRLMNWLCFVLTSICGPICPAWRGLSHREAIWRDQRVRRYYPLWGHGKPRRWPPAGFLPSALRRWVLWSSEALMALLLIRLLGTECVTALWACFTAVL